MGAGLLGCFVPVPLSRPHEARLALFPSSPFSRDHEPLKGSPAPTTDTFLLSYPLRCTRTRTLNGKLTRRDATLQPETWHLRLQRICNMTVLTHDGGSLAMCSVPTVSLACAC